MGKFCKDCGQKKPENSVFCPNCGASDGRARSGQQRNERQTTRHPRRAPQHDQYDGHPASDGFPPSRDEEYGGSWEYAKPSGAPFVLGIIGSSFLVPGLFCAACFGVGCAYEIIDPGTMFRPAVTRINPFIYTLVILATLIPTVGGIFGALKGKTDPNLAMIIFFASAFLTLISLWLTLFISPFHWVSLILFIIAGFLANRNKRFMY